MTGSCGAALPSRCCTVIVTLGHVLGIALGFFVLRRVWAVFVSET